MNVEFKVDHRFFNSVVTLATVGILFYLVTGGTVDKSSLVGMLGGVAFNVSLFLCSVFGLQYFQLGTDRDLQKEIFDQKNVAAAIYQGFIFLGLAMVIAKGLF